MPGIRGDDPETDDDDLPSRSGLRRERREVEETLMQLARELVLLSDRMLTKLDLPETVTEAVLEARGIKNGSSRNRALRQVRVAIRGVDAALIQNRLKDLNDPSRSGAPSHVLALWRERLVTGKEADLADFLTAFPAADRQQLRQLLRNVRKATEAARVESLRVLTKALRVHLG